MGTAENYVTKLRKPNKNKYLSDRCSGCKNGKDSWDTLKPILSTKNRGTDCDIVLKEDGNMVTVQNQVCKRFNKYYVSAASAIGQPDTILEACTLEKVPEKKKSLRRCTQA